jgi:hypothetical protein
MDREIMCITRKTPPTKDCTCIKYVGTIDSDYVVPISDVIKLIESGKDRFYVLDQNAENKVYVTIAKKGDMKYIRVRDYDTDHDELLKISECKLTNRAPNERASLLIHGIRDLLDR